MLSSNRSHYLAIGGCLAFLLLAIPALGQQENRSATQEPEEQATEQPAVVAQPASPPVPAAEPSSSGHDEERQPEERQQTQSAIERVWGWAAGWFEANIGGRDGWAQWIMAGAGILALGVSIWAVRLLRHTLQATRDAVGEARNANRVAEKGVAVTLESGKAQVRAYMSLSDFKIKIDADNKVVIKYRYTNNGQSPAVRVTIDIGATVEKLPFFGGPINRTVTHILDDVPAHFSEENEARISLGISAEAMAVYSANAFGAFVAYRIAYEDVFGDSHIRSMNYIGLWAPGAKKDDFVRMNRSPLDDNRGGGYSEQPPPSPKDKTP